MTTLITQTLLSSWLYTFNCAEGYEEEANDDFLRTLRREPGEQSEAMLNGIKFENSVYALARNPQDMTVWPAWKAAASKVADIIRGGQIQVKVQRNITVGNDTYLIYGILDALKAGTIYDVKFSSKGFGSAELAGKYLESPQHPAYMYCVPEAFAFKYLVSDGQDIYIETYTRKMTPDIGEIIRNFRTDLRARGLEEIYLEKWEAQ